MLKIRAVKAVSATVSDADQACKLYTQALGFQIIRDVTFAADTYSRLAPAASSRVRIMALQLGDETIELIEFLDVEAKPIPEDSQSNDLWFQHIAIMVSDLDAAYQKLQDFSITPISDGPQTLPPDKAIAGNVRAFKFRDRDGHGLEILWFPAGVGPDKWQQPTEALFLGIDHSAIAIAETSESLQLYRDYFGLTVADSGVNYGEAQAAMDGLPAAEVKINSLQTAAPGPGIELLDYVKPGTGRSRPEDWTMSDLSHRHLVLEVEGHPDFEHLPQQNLLQVVSPGWIDLPDEYPFAQGCWVKDPNGHSLLLVTSPNR